MLNVVLVDPIWHCNVIIVLFSLLLFEPYSKIPINVPFENSIGPLHLNCHLFFCFMINGCQKIEQSTAHHHTDRNLPFKPTEVGYSKTGPD